MYKNYLYRHIRQDKNTPFYIGISTKYGNINSIISEYKRAYDGKNRRNKIWKDIVSKTSYQIEIMLESDDYEFIKEREKEFIKLYGRIDIGTGVLANMTDGGEGNTGIIYNKNRALKISLANKGRVKSIKEREAISKRMKKPVIEKETGREFESIHEAAIYEGISVGSLYQKLWACSNSCKYKYKDDSLNFPKKTTKGRGKAGHKVKNIETGEIFDTCKDAAEAEGMNLDTFYSAFKWKKKYFKYVRLKKLNKT